MKSKSNSDSAMRNTPAPGQENTPGNHYAPSVPITVYRELAAELQATKAMLDSMNTQNQQVTRQNQQLRQEIERLVQSALTLQQLAGLSQSQNVIPTATTQSQATPNTVAEMVRSQAARSGQRPPRTAPVPESVAQPPKTIEPTPLSDDLFSEQVETPQRIETKPTSKDVGGLWLTVTIMVIVATAFAAGFLVVRPFLSNR